MIARLWHLYRTELRSHRWVLLLWLAAQLLVAASALTMTWIWDHVTEQDYFSPTPSFIQQLDQWCFRIMMTLDSWVDLTAGLLAAWIALADPLQSPTAFWPTRPARLGEVVLAKALVCFSVFCVVPACCGLAAGWMLEASLRDILLSGLTFLTFKAGLVPVGFLVGILLPAPGKRLTALLTMLGLWLGSLSWDLMMSNPSDFRDKSLTYLVVWMVALAALPLLLRGRRSVATQAALAVLAVALPWMTGPVKRQLHKVPPRTCESLGIAALGATPKPSSYYFSEQKDDGAPKKVMVEVTLDVRGLPAGVAARAIFGDFETEPQTGGKALHSKWEDLSLIMPTYYDALAHALGVTPDKIPAEWRHEDNTLEIAVPQALFTEWKDEQALKISGKVRVLLYRVRKLWEGVPREQYVGLNQVLRVEGARLALWPDTGKINVQATRPQIADLIVLSDFSPTGSLFNHTIASWMVAFQPPVKGPDGTFSRELRRTPALWADGLRENDMYDTRFWRSMFSTNLEIEDHPAEIREVGKGDGEKLKGLPVVLLNRAAYAEVEVPLTPVVLTKRQILETRKIIPAKP